MARLDPFVGVPWAEGGAAMDGANCYGLVRLVYAGCLGIALSPEVDADAWRAADLDDARPFDLVLMRERPWHVGLVAAPGLMLHMPAERASVVEPFTTGRHACRVEGLYRHVSRP